MTASIPKSVAGPWFSDVVVYTAKWWIVKDSAGKEYSWKLCKVNLKLESCIPSLNDIPNSKCDPQDGINWTWNNYVRILDTETGF